MILILGGTSDSIKIAEALRDASKPFYISVVSDYGQKLASKVTPRVLQGRLSKEAMSQVIEQRQIKLIIDVTHPFAVEVSKTAMAASQASHINYLRFERPTVIPEGVLLASSVKEACELAKDYTGRIYLTTGSKTLPAFIKYLPKERLIVRLLPTSEVLQMTEELGLSADQIEGMKGPFSKALNQELLIHNQAAVLITKESGKAGGFLEKVEACQELNIPCIVIEREKLDYPLAYSSIEQLVAYVKQNKELTE
ncbi:cobalt-precorrin-6A/precorrin-6x reductase [Enterococcus florum]|uniref:Cobalt-precorrin-6A/precorrin-6x reductase n=1 Tax=Enterococcus florum TaxID=2480627 RepID=A0A4P5PBT2_9ENTE|nr:precorrin-6A reductase [Enterococcus florum]GCF95206.1 cobalt-precorrin-6A/precorrin-6x reductase [Enterococcus florum]